jgi:hypothetical protein
MKTKEKKRLSRKYNNVWLDKDNYIHICNFLTCENGCDCENQKMSFSYFEGIYKKLKEILQNIESL